jgi:hypothetical protein
MKLPPTLFYCGNIGLMLFLQIFKGFETPHYVTFSLKFEQVKKDPKFEQSERT